MLERPPEQPFTPNVSMNFHASPVIGSIDVLVAVRCINLVLVSAVYMGAGFLSAKLGVEGGSAGARQLSRYQW